MYKYIRIDMYIYICCHLRARPLFLSTESPVSCLAFGASAGGSYISSYAYICIYAFYVYRVNPIYIGLTPGVYVNS